MKWVKSLPKRRFLSARENKVLSLFYSEQGRGAGETEVKGTRGGMGRGEDFPFRVSGRYFVKHRYGCFRCPVYRTKNLPEAVTPCVWNTARYMPAATALFPDAVHFAVISDCSNVSLAILLPSTA